MRYESLLQTIKMNISFELSNQTITYKNNIPIMTDHWHYCYKVPHTFFCNKNIVPTYRIVIIASSSLLFRTLISNCIFFRVVTKFSEFRDWNHWSVLSSHSRSGTEWFHDEKLSFILCHYFKIESSPSSGRSLLLT